MPSPAPTDRERLVAGLHLYSLARRPVADDLVRPDGWRFLHQHEVTDSWEALANRRTVRAALGLTRVSQRPMGRNKYLASLREVLDGQEAARWTRRGPSERKVNLFQTRAVAFDRDHEPEWPALFQYLDAAEDFEDIDALAVTTGFDISSPLPREFLFTAVPVAPITPDDVEDLDDEPRVCRGPISCGAALPPSAFREIRGHDRTPRLARQCRTCEAQRLALRRAANPDEAARYTAAQRDRYREAAFAREAAGRASAAHPATKRCADCGRTYEAPVALHFTTDRTRPDSLSRICRRCAAQASDRRRHPGSSA